MPRCVRKTMSANLNSRWQTQRAHIRNRYGRVGEREKCEQRNNDTIKSFKLKRATGDKVSAHTSLRFVENKYIFYWLYSAFCSNQTHMARRLWTQTNENKNRIVLCQLIFSTIHTKCSYQRHFHVIRSNDRR